MYNMAQHILYYATSEMYCITLIMFLDVCYNSHDVTSQMYYVTLIIMFLNVLFLRQGKFAIVPRQREFYGHLQVPRNPIFVPG